MDSGNPSWIPEAPLPLRRLRFVCTALGGSLQALEGGNALRGTLGAVLRERFPDAFSLLFGEQSGRCRPRLYILRPPLDRQGSYAPGDVLTFEITLFQEAVDLAGALLTAMLEVGDRGIGRDRGRFSVDLLQEVTPNGSKLVWSAETGPLEAAQAFDARALLVAATEVPSGSYRLTLRFVTPLMLKEANEQTDRVEMSLVIRRLVGRYAQLTGQSISEPGLGTLFDQANRVEIIDDRLRWQKTERYSARQRQTMPQSGLVGTIEYRGPMSALLPWLQMGEWLHLGNKVTFGFGLYRIAKLQ